MPNESILDISSRYVLNTSNKKLLQRISNICLEHFLEHCFWVNIVHTKKSSRSINNAYQIAWCMVYKSVCHSTLPLCFHPREQNTNIWKTTPVSIEWLHSLLKTEAFELGWSNWLNLNWFIEHMSHNACFIGMCNRKHIFTTLDPAEYAWVLHICA